MKLRKGTKQDSTEVYLVLLTYDEEHELAKRFFDIMSKHWLERYSEFQELAKSLFFKKSYGRDFVEQDILDFAEWIDKINNNLIDRYDNADIWLIEDPFYFLKMDDKHIEIPMPQYTSRRTLQDNIKRYEREVSRAWKEAWEINGKNVYPNFPGDDILKTPASHDDPKEVARDKRREEAFWKRVDQIQTECSCSRNQAVLEVSDYMPRAEHPENRVDDPDPGMVVTPEVYVED